MPQQKPSAQIFTADGEGGMRAVADHRFEAGAWPISFVVKTTDATLWMAHLHAECEVRGWQSGGLSQIDAAENSGSLSLHAAAGAAPPTLEIAWEKVRDESLRIRARTGGSPLLSLDVARDFFSAVDVRLRNKTTVRAHRRAFLTYDVLEWRGELWLDVDLRLGPPTKNPAYLYGPQIVVVDAMVGGIGFQGVNAQFQRTLAELRIFLTAVLGSHFELDKQREGWTYSRDGNGRVADLRLASLGYIEVEGEASPGFPPIGAAPPIERRAIARPGIGAGGVTTRERWVPDDIEQLWRIFCALPAHKRDHFLRAGNAHLVAQTMWPDQRTAYASFLVVACEALKPRGRSSRAANVYDVVESLGGAGEGVKLRSLSVAPQKVRSDHFHRGELLADELGSLLISDPFMDPSFNGMLDALATLSRVCLIEWLRCKGEYKVVYIPRDIPRRGWRLVVSDVLRWLIARVQR